MKKTFTLLLLVIPTSPLSARPDVPVHYIPSFVSANPYDKVSLIHWMKYNLYNFEGHPVIDYIDPITGKSNYTLVNDDELTTFLLDLIEINNEIQDDDITIERLTSTTFEIDSEIVDVSHVSWCIKNDADPATLYYQ